MLPSPSLRSLSGRCEARPKLAEVAAEQRLVVPPQHDDVVAQRVLQQAVHHRAATQQGHPHLRGRVRKHGVGS